MTTSNTKQDIRCMPLGEIRDYIISVGGKKFNADQIYEWIWTKGVLGFDDMTNLDKGLRATLNNQFIFRPISVKYEQQSDDGTLKCGFNLFDGNLVEGVLIPTSNRLTCCISSQAGCSLNCSFCATGKLDLKRNLYAHEIFDQVRIMSDLAMKKFERPISNVVYMGMGEPLLNYKEVLSSIDKITRENGLGIAARRITVSTAGISKMIRKLGEENGKCRLALSLHAASDEKRSQIMEINDSNNLESLKKALIYYYNNTKLKVTLEYVLLKGFNDTPEDAKRLAVFSKKFPSKVNLIEYNPVEDVPWTSSDEPTMTRFAKILESNKVIAKLRRSRGKDIDAACGQLANKMKRI